MITARENILMAYHHQEPYWVPSQYLDQNTCLVYGPPVRGSADSGGVRTALAYPGIINPGDPSPMVTAGTKRLTDIE